MAANLVSHGRAMEVAAPSLYVQVPYVALTRFLLSLPVRGEVIVLTLSSWGHRASSKADPGILYSGTLLAHSTL